MNKAKTIGAVLGGIAVAAAIGLLLFIKEFGDFLNDICGKEEEDEDGT